MGGAKSYATRLHQINPVAGIVSWFREGPLKPCDRESIVYISKLQPIILSQCLSLACSAKCRSTPGSRRLPSPLTRDHKSFELHPFSMPTLERISTRATATRDAIATLPGHKRATETATQCPPRTRSGFRRSACCVCATPTAPSRTPA